MGAGDGLLVVGLDQLHDVVLAGGGVDLVQGDVIRERAVRRQQDLAAKPALRIHL